MRLLETNEAYLLSALIINLHVSVYLYTRQTSCDSMPPISYDQTKHWFQLFIDVIEMQTRIAIQQTAGAYRI